MLPRGDRGGEELLDGELIRTMEEPLDWGRKVPDGGIHDDSSNRDETLLVGNSLLFQRYFT